MNVLNKVFHENHGVVDIVLKDSRLAICGKSDNFQRHFTRVLSPNIITSTCVDAKGFVYIWSDDINMGKGSSMMNNNSNPRDKKSKKKDEDNTVMEILRKNETDDFTYVSS